MYVTCKHDLNKDFAVNISKSLYLLVKNIILEDVYAKNNKFMGQDLAAHSDQLENVKATGVQTRTQKKQR